jgi:uncharacterized protein
MKQVIVIHGGDFFDSRADFVASLKKSRVSKEDFLPRHEKRWRYTLSSDLGDSFEVLLPEMPNKYDAKYDEWKIWFEKILPFVGPGAVFVGHSLGGIFLARYLSEEKLPKKAKALILLSAPFFKPSKKKKKSENAGFIIKKDLKKIEESCESVFVFHSSDDQMVPFKHSKVYKKNLPKSHLIELHGLGHLYKQERFPELVETIRSLFS